jgi:hypothetical protein
MDGYSIDAITAVAHLRAETRTRDAQAERLARELRRNAPGRRLRAAAWRSRRPPWPSALAR